MAYLLLQKKPKTECSQDLRNPMAPFVRDLHYKYFNISQTGTFSLLRDGAAAPHVSNTSSSINRAHFSDYSDGKLLLRLLREGMLLSGCVVFDSGSTYLVSKGLQAGFYIVRCLQEAGSSLTDTAGVDISRTEIDSDLSASERAFVNMGEGAGLQLDTNMSEALCSKLFIGAVFGSLLLKNAAQYSRACQISMSHLQQSLRGFKVSTSAETFSMNKTIGATSKDNWIFKEVISSNDIDPSKRLTLPDVKSQARDVKNTHYSLDKNFSSKFVGHPQFYNFLVRHKSLNENEYVFNNMEYVKNTFHSNIVHSVEIMRKTTAKTKDKVNLLKSTIGKNPMVGITLDHLRNKSLKLAPVIIELVDGSKVVLFSRKSGTKNSFSMRKTVENLRNGTPNVAPQVKETLKKSKKFLSSVLNDNKINSTTRKVVENIKKSTAKAEPRIKEALSNSEDMVFSLAEKIKSKAKDSPLGETVSAVARNPWVKKATNKEALRILRKAIHYGLLIAMDPNVSSDDPPTDASTDLESSESSNRMQQSQDHKADNDQSENKGE